MSNNYLSRVKREIAVWENEGPGFLSQASDFLLYPAQWAAEALIPEFIRETAETCLRGCLETLMGTGPGIPFHARKFFPG